MATPPWLEKLVFFNCVHSSEQMKDVVPAMIENDDQERAFAKHQMTEERLIKCVK